jgi:hypothetical protein
MSRHRTSYGTFTLRGDAEGVVHLEGELPEVVAIGMDAWREFYLGIPQLGGPHAEVRLVNNRPQLHVTTPEGEFIYEPFSGEQDKDGYYVLARLIFTSSTYHAFLAGH